MYGLNSSKCSTPCGKCANGGQCNWRNGVCAHGCESGYHGTLCDQICAHVCNEVCEQRTGKNVLIILFKVSIVKICTYVKAIRIKQQ